MSFTKNNITILAPIGAIAPYLGTSDPGGWIICDGVQRTNGTDGRYNSLITMGIGSGTANVNYTPPNLTGKFLYGSSNTGQLNATGGSSTVTLAVANLPKHTHSGTTGNPSSNLVHSHAENYLTSYGGSQNGYSGVTGNTRASTTPISVAIASTNNSAMNHSHTFTTTAQTGVGTAFSIMPSYLTVNWIIKIT